MNEYMVCESSVEAFVFSFEALSGTQIDTGALAPPRKVMAIRTSPADWLAEALDAIERLLTLGKNWDSYGANAVDQESVRRASELAQRLAWVENVEAPSITATPDGDVGFCWDTGEWSLDASVDPTGLISYVLLDEGDPSQEQEGRTRNVNDLAELATRW